MSGAIQPRVYERQERVPPRYHVVTPGQDTARYASHAPTRYVLALILLLKKVDTGNKRGDGVKVSIVCASLIASATLFPPQIIAGEEPAGMIVPTSHSPNTIGWTTRTYDKPLTSAPGQPPVITSPERPPRVGIKAIRDTTVPAEPPQIDGRERAQVETDMGEFLLPVWDRGFWLMPPGGMTRWLIIPRGFINPDQTLANDPVDMDSACRECPARTDR